MKELIGFNMAVFSVSLIIIWIIGGDYDWKERLIMSISEPIIMCILSVGVYLMAGGTK